MIRLCDRRDPFANTGSTVPMGRLYIFLSLGESIALRIGITELVAALTVPTPRANCRRQVTLGMGKH